MILNLVCGYLLIIIKMITKKTKEVIKEPQIEQKLIYSTDEGYNWRNLIFSGKEYPDQLIKKGWRIVSFSNANSMAGAGTQYSKDWKEKDRIIILLEKEVD